MCTTSICKVTCKRICRIPSRADPSWKRWSIRNNFTSWRRIFILAVIIWTRGNAIKNRRERERGGTYAESGSQAKGGTPIELGSQVDIFSSNFTSLLMIIFLNFGWRSLYPLTSLEYPTKMHFSLLGSKALCFASGIWAQASIPKTRKWLTSGLIELQASYGVIFFKTLVGVQFTM